MIPAGALHIEGEAAATITYIVATAQPRPFVEVFRLRSPDDPERPSSRPEGLTETFSETFGSA